MENCSKKKRPAVITLFILVIAFQVGANTSVALENGAKYWFYYELDPEYLSFYRYTDPDYDHYVLKYFNRPVGEEAFIPLSPGHVHDFAELSVGEHVVVGFFVPKNSLIYPVKIINISVEETAGERRYVVHNTTSNISVTPGTGMLETFQPETTKISDRTGIKIEIDNSYSDWNGVPIIAGFAENFNPVYFTREFKGDISTLAMENSLFWKYGGTQLKDVKAYIDDYYLYLSVSSYSQIKDGFLLYCYMYKERGVDKKNRYTIEWTVDPEKEPGVISFWEDGINVPVEVGSFYNTGYYLEGRIHLLKLPVEIQYSLKSLYSLDLTSCYFDKMGELYEEFFFTTLFFRDIPMAEDIVLY